MNKRNHYNYVAFRVIQLNPNEPIYLQGQTAPNLHWKTLRVYACNLLHFVKEQACDCAVVASYVHKRYVPVYNGEGNAIAGYRCGCEDTRVKVA